MQFNSYVFIMVFLPIMVISYFLANKIGVRQGKAVLIIGGAIFYLYGGMGTALVLGVSIAANCFFSQMIRRKENYKKIILFIAVAADMGMLLYYKYSGFFLENINSFLNVDFLGKAQTLVLPLGVSFFTFQQIAYVVSVYRGEVKEADIMDYLAYITYFPKLLMGPLVEPADFIGQLNDKKTKTVNWDHIADGIRLFGFGLFKKMVLADTFAGAVNWGYENIETATSMDLFLIMLFYTFQIYFDFSGYTDMATGVSDMLNIELPMNFNSPYKASSIRDFWKRWHMSLTSFLTKYIYIPLGGNRKGRIRTYVNTLIVFLISGLWHGANWTFIRWGSLHGILSVLERVFEKPFRKLIEPVRWMLTFLAVSCLWLLFRSDSVAQWHKIMYHILTFQSTAVSDGLLAVFRLPETDFIETVFHLGALSSSVNGFWMLLFSFGAFFLCLVPENNYKCRGKNNLFFVLLTAVAFVWGFVCLGSETVFVYSNF